MTYAEWSALSVDERNAMCAEKVWPHHPTADGLVYLGMGEPRKLTRSQARYREYLQADSGLTFAEWLGIEPGGRRDEG